MSNFNWAALLQSYFIEIAKGLYYNTFTFEIRFEGVGIGLKGHFFFNSIITTIWFQLMSKGSFIIPHALMNDIVRLPLHLYRGLKEPF